MEGLGVESLEVGLSQAAKERAGKICHCPLQQLEGVDKGREFAVRFKVAGCVFMVALIQCTDGQFLLKYSQIKELESHMMTVHHMQPSPQPCQGYQEDIPPLSNVLNVPVGQEEPTGRDIVTLLPSKLDR